MAIGCKNCGAYFTREEILRRKPPLHAWPLTAIGEKILAENLASGTAQAACPTCGCQTLRG